MAAIIRKWDERPWHHFNVKQVAGFNNGPGLTDMAESKTPVRLPPGVFETTEQVNWGFDGARIFGCSRYAAIRPTSDAELETSYGVTNSTVIRWEGGADNADAVIKIAEPAIAVPFDSANNNPTTGVSDDLLDVIIQGITADANNLVGYGFYGYRCGNGSDISELTALRSTRIGMLFSGGFSSSSLRGLRAYRNKRIGIAIGHNPFNDTASVTYSQFEWTVNAVSINGLHASNNGIEETWDESTNPFEGSIIISLGRNCLVFNVSCETNDNPLVVMPTRRATFPASGDYFLTSASNLCSNSRISGVYLENNCDDAVADLRATRPYGMIIKNDYYGGGLRIEDVWQHPGSTLPEQHIKIVSVDVDPPSETAETDGLGSSDLSRQLKLIRVGPGGDIDSNTTLFRVEDVDATVTYLDDAPNDPSGGGQLSQTTGTFLLQIQGEGTVGTHAGTQTGYLKIGREVTLYIDVDTTTLDAVGNLTFITLPVAPDINSWALVGNLRAEVAASTYVTIWARFTASSTTVQLYKDGPATGMTRLLDTDLGGAAGSWDIRLLGTVKYRAAQ